MLRPAVRCLWTRGSDCALKGEGDEPMGQPRDTLWTSQPRTLLKHQVYRRYLHCWMGKICQRFQNSAIVDGFAGPGAYVDGPDGSPVVIPTTFLEHSLRPKFNLLRLIFLEKDPHRRDHLATRVAALANVPLLNVQVPPPAALLDYFPVLRRAAHGSDPATPVLWILDPFDLSSVPYSLVQDCMSGPRDEVLITWFADEIYRFSQDPAKEPAIDRHFGTGTWRQTRKITGESARKEKLLQLYQESLQQLPGVHTGAFSIASKNETARYALVFATHSDARMECFNQTRRRMDPYRGHHVSEKRSAGQMGLFDDTPELSPLRKWLESKAGQAISLEELARQAGRRGYKETHLRPTRPDMAEDGLAFPEEPLASTRTLGPAGSRIRFYSAPNVS